ncbi:MAG TPA: hypothetical protein VI364_08360 [Actinomycetota bacterium]
MDNGQEQVAAVYRDQAQRMWRALFGFAGDPDIASDAIPRRSLVRSGIEEQSVT